jgi:hypothetical protein
MSWQLPKKFQITPEMLADADKQQAIWSQSVSSPFGGSSGVARERANAAIIIREMAEMPRNKLYDNQRNELAEAYAAVGRYDEAAMLFDRGSLIAAQYLLIWAAIWRSDEKWCEHSSEHQYVEKDIWSVKHREERPLLRCNVCGMVNVTTLPPVIARQRAERQKARQQSQKTRR